MTRSKQIGTAGERAVADYATLNGFPTADRRVMYGKNDRGDILLSDQAIIEVKAGKAAQYASLKQIDDWLAESERERINADVPYVLLVIQHRGIGTGRVHLWDCWFSEKMSQAIIPGFCFKLMTDYETGLQLLKGKLNE